MNETLVTFEIAQLAFEKGFNESTDFIYYDGEIYNPLYKQIKEDYDNFVVRERGSNWDYVEKDSYLKSLYNLVISNNYTGDLKIPTQNNLQKWLREKHNIFVMCTQEFYPDGINYLVQVFKYTPEKEKCCEGTMIYGDNGEFKSLEDSMEFGLELGLKMI